MRGEKCFAIFLYVVGGEDYIALSVADVEHIVEGVGGVFYLGHWDDFVG